jgi:hypothetical protein
MVSLFFFGGSPSEDLSEEGSLSENLSKKGSPSEDLSKKGSSPEDLSKKGSPSEDLSEEGGFRAVRYTPRANSHASATAGCRFHPGRSA